MKLFEKRYFGFTLLYLLFAAYFNIRIACLPYLQENTVDDFKIVIFLTRVAMPARYRTEQQSGKRGKNVWGQIKKIIDRQRCSELFLEHMGAKVRLRGPSPVENQYGGNDMQEKPVTNQTGT